MSELSEGSRYTQRPPGAHAPLSADTACRATGHSFFPSSVTELTTGHVTRARRRPAEFLKPLPPPSACAGCFGDRQKSVCPQAARAPGEITQLAGESGQSPAARSGETPTPGLPGGSSARALCATRREGALRAVAQPSAPTNPTSRGLGRGSPRTLGDPELAGDPGLRITENFTR